MNLNETKEKQSSTEDQNLCSGHNMSTNVSPQRVIAERVLVKRSGENRPSYTASISR